ncbi:MAG: 16S rRNA (guanine(966)-N(2))-methyltransferase RsmD [Bdellovibrionales bacterium]
MRIIAGKFKGHRLVSFSAHHLRPTTDRVKESIFNKLQMTTPGSRFLDLFAGTGALSIEALSRDAAEVVSVESNPKSLKIIRENLEKLKISTGVEIQPLDVFKYLQRYKGAAFDVVLADPPFTQKLADQVMQAIAGSAVIGPGTVVVVEASAHETMQDSYPPLVLTDRKDYGDKLVSFFACP